MKRSVYNSAHGVTSLTPAARTATANGTTVDRSEPSLSNFRSAALHVHVGTVTDGDHDFKIEVSDNDSDWSDAPAADLQGSIPTVDSTNDEQVHELGYTGPARYLRAVVTVASATTGGVYGAAFVLGDARRTPIPRS